MYIYSLPLTFHKQVDETNFSPVKLLEQSPGILKEEAGQGVSGGKYSQTLWKKEASALLLEAGPGSRSTAQTGTENAAGRVDVPGLVQIQQDGAVDKTQMHQT